ncbi:glutamate--tRNA ligase [Coxiella burnetii]|uniref:Glutamate--tRNA ligase 2 n=1 Tax=Coxiella burnetii (strain CbuK_Q154) TaxID=434924 RepID=SYE2_COXB1|nr:glutamate--tRNA ligase [Coxiella burnetii]B6J4I8.1 RecName: Full=Glutamate--tRNA ligase 2; AltName: Full=Glutamyl-tRNA synthetase 2; Short=GluRS 2 [Coxiella burnetii CbuK_Q154]ACJ20853.1 glutamyl-tRNA synthetase [Coxiella burnetii CbuK_Q154]EAX31978.2 glutamate--tRNA ligase [Coxiella burnetii 'MSU Goat Q177']UYK69231.1 glutamate--tRNA ligase [Coxiella burnetii]
MMKSRFCPSPTGLMHLGNARTALFNYLFAKSKDGIFLLRIEDTDVERSKETFDLGLQEDLRWLNLEWQEGPGADEGNGPYHQSKRQAIYDDYYQRLEEADQAYPCFCSEEQLRLSRKIQRSAGKPPRYAGTCRSLSAAEIEKKKAEGLQPALRFRVPDDEVVVFADLVRGEQRFQTNDIGDFIIRRANGTSPFMFCNAIDDALMGVSHVLRGEDHLTNTPRQLLILQALELPVPTYAHIALIVGPDGSPLSKRHGSRGIKELRDNGYLPLALTNYLARLGHYYASDELLSLAELAKGFNVESLSKSPVKFNAQQLDYWQKQTVNQLPNDDFWEWAGSELQSQIPTDKADLFLTTVKPNVSFPRDVAYWVNVCFGKTLNLETAQSELLRATGNRYFEEAFEAFKKFGKDLNSVVSHLKEKLNLKGKPLYQPLRIALTGAEHGPELAKLILIMDYETIQNRLQEACQ